METFLCGKRFESNYLKATKMSSCLLYVVVWALIIATSLGDDTTMTSLEYDTNSISVDHSSTTQSTASMSTTSVESGGPLGGTTVSSTSLALTHSVSTSGQETSGQATTTQSETETNLPESSSTTDVAATSTHGDDEITVIPLTTTNESETIARTSSAMTSSYETTTSNRLSPNDTRETSSVIDVLTTSMSSILDTSENSTTRNESTETVTEVVNNVISSTTEMINTTSDNDTITSDNNTTLYLQNSTESVNIDITYTNHTFTQTENMTSGIYASDATTTLGIFVSTMLYLDNDTTTVTPENETATDNGTFLLIPDQKPTKEVKLDTTQHGGKEPVTDSDQIITVIFEKGSTKPSEKPRSEDESTETAKKVDLEVISVTMSIPVTTWSPPFYITFILKSSWEEFCEENFREEFKMTLSKLVGKVQDRQREESGNEDEENTVSSGQVILYDASGCSSTEEPVHYRRRRSDDGSVVVSVYLNDHKGHYSYPLTKALGDLLRQPNRDSVLAGTFLEDMVIDVKFHGDKAQLHSFDGSGEDSSWQPSAGVLAGIVVGVLAALILLTLLIMQLVVNRKRKRVKKMRHSSYDNRHSIDTLHGLGMDNIQLTGMRKTANHWAYVNPALIIDDKDFSSNPLNFNALCNIAKAPEVIEDEFMMLPNYISRVTDIPLGAEDKNRYANVIPVPETRVLLHNDRSKDDCFNYINANFVRGYLCAPKSYIATQAPLDNTRGDYWHMVYEQKAQAILMLTALAEHGSPRCSEYWPNTDGGDTQRTFGQYEILLLKRDIRREWITSALRVKKINSKQYLDVYHFWLTAWPAQGLPEAKTVIGFLLAARPYMEVSMGPTIVHCSPGTGRTGAVISVDIQMMAYDDSKLVDILSCVSGLRQDRAGLVQTREQYKFIYQALMEYAQAIHSTSRNPSRDSSIGSLHVPDIVHS